MNFHTQLPPQRLNRHRTMPVELVVMHHHTAGFEHRRKVFILKKHLKCHHLTPPTNLSNPT